MRLSSRLRLALLTAVLMLGACEERAPVPPPPATNPEASDLVEEPPVTVTTREPGEVLMLDVPHLLQASAEQGEEVYGITRDDATQRWFTFEGEPVDAQVVAAWLDQFTPLEAEGRYPDLAADSVMANVTHRLVFRFDDGSGRTLALEQRPDGLAAVSQVDGPVFRLPRGRLDELVPPPSYLSAE